MRRLWLDDLRPAPKGWERYRWPDEMITAIESASPDMRDPTFILAISLDHDLGTDDVLRERTGQEVLDWLEAWCEAGHLPPPNIHIHSMNPVGRQRMLVTKDRIKRYSRLNAGVFS